ncbi:MAG: ABC transporter permease [Thermoguttaceae bacterium]|nr:ABC transporter permease [Thermoguttaceae bacterium]MBQ2555396.1 ABC transporter permease [Thermoguttaceae bacterium]
MYKLLLIWRYLLTRRIAYASVISVTLGVASMIVVNAVMLGFSREMQDRIHGALSDVTIRSQSSLAGFEDVDARIRDVHKIAGDMVEAVTPTVTTPGLMSYDFGGGEVVSRQVQIVGIDTATNEKVTALSQYLQHPENRRQLSFELREGGYDVQNPNFGDSGTVRLRLADSGWRKRREDAEYARYRWQEQQRQREMYANMKKPDSAPTNKDVVDYAAENAADAAESSGGDPYAAALANLPDPPVYDEDGEAPNESETPGDPTALAEDEPGAPEDAQEEDDGPRRPSTLVGTPFDGLKEFETKFDPGTMQETGVIVGVGLVAGMRRKHLNPETGKNEVRESLLRVPGDDVTLSFLASGAVNSLPSIVYDRFTIVDLYECHMAEYDDTMVFVPIEKLQTLRKMIADNGTKMATHLLIKAKPGVKIEDLRDRLANSEEFPEQLYAIETWKDQQATTLAAVATEQAILNVLLFISIAVAGFGILAIFFMIVVEKTRDVGILKSLGASGSGIMQVFLFYGLTLGLIGAGLGLALGFWFVAHIQNVADFLSRVMGHEVFDPTIYMFQRVPAIIEPSTVVWIVIGALFIAVSSSVLPAIRAARLKPVDALRV